MKTLRYTVSFLLLMGALASCHKELSPTPSRKPGEPFPEQAPPPDEVKSDSLTTQDIQYPRLDAYGIQVAELQCSEQCQELESMLEVMAEQKKVRDSLFLALVHKRQRIDSLRTLLIAAKQQL